MLTRRSTRPPAHPSARLGLLALLVGSLLAALGGADAAESSGASAQLPAPEATREATPPYSS